MWSVLPALLLFDPAAPALARQTPTPPAFTLVSRETNYASGGEKLVVEETLYASAAGGARRVRKKEDGSLSGDYLYERGRGHFHIDHAGRKLLLMDGAPDAPDPPPTAESLRADPGFVRTEEVLGRTTFVIRHVVGGGGAGPPPAERSYEHYYDPDLGRTPLKSVYFEGGRVSSVREPVSLTFGEPDAALFKIPAYEVSPPPPAGGVVSGGKVSEWVAPVWPKEARGVTGTVVVKVLLDEEGRVYEAVALSGPEELRPAAVEAAHKARFTPAKLSGRPVKASSTLSFKFSRQ